MPTEKPYNTTSTGAMRESIGTKLPVNLVPYELIIAAALGLEYGKDKYAARNFEKGLSYTDHIESIKRHAFALEAREELDEDSGLPHYVLLASSAAMLCHNIIQGVVIDDRPVPKQGSTISDLAIWARGVQELAKEYRNAPPR